MIDLLCLLCFLDTDFTINNEMIRTEFHLDRTWQTNKLWNHIVFASVLLICFNSNCFIRSDGNIGEFLNPCTFQRENNSPINLISSFFCAASGCLFSEDVCIPEVEWCFDGKHDIHVSHCETVQTIGCVGNFRFVIWKMFIGGRRARW